MRTADFVTYLKTQKMYFKHDGHPDRPFAKLVSGLIADGYIDVTTDDPVVLGVIAKQILHVVHATVFRQADCIVGLPYASLHLAYELAQRLRKRVAFLEFSRTEPDTLVLQRYQRYLAGKRVVLVDNAMTTGDTLLAAVNLLSAANVAVESIVCVANWSGTRALKDTGIPVYSALEPTFTMWAPGDNPLVEMVPPLKPKVGNNWELLNKTYP